MKWLISHSSLRGIGKIIFRSSLCACDMYIAKFKEFWSVSFKVCWILVFIHPPLTFPTVLQLAPHVLKVLDGWKRSPIASTTQCQHPYSCMHLTECLCTTPHLLGTAGGGSGR
eukprot:11294764-Karenia_brevis.AAC.1